MLTTVETECAYASYIAREDKVAACMGGSVDAQLPEGFEFQVECDV